jgi:hypothetical protein
MRKIGENAEFQVHERGTRIKLNAIARLRVSTNRVYNKRDRLRKKIDGAENVGKVDGPIDSN